MGVRRTLAALGLMSGVCMVTHSARAEPNPSDDPRQQARDLMRAGNDRYRSGDLKGARESYQRAFDTAKSFDVACNLGRTEMELQLFRDAAEHLDYCVRFHILSSKPEMMLNEQEARDKLRAAKARVGSLWLSVEPSAAEIWVDSRMVGRAPLVAPVFVEPGPHEVRVTSPQMAESTTRVAARAGTEQTLKIQLSPESSGANFAGAMPGSTFPASDELQRKHSSWGVVPWLSGGLSLVGIGVGAGFLVVAHDKQSDKEDVLTALPEAHPCAENTPHVNECARVRQLAQDGRTAQAIGYTSLGVGVAAAVTTAVLLLQSPHTTTASKRHAPQARVVPSVSSDRLFVSLDARF
ncbi:MAG TPA: PEGA domain-containing protein [Polyangiaceae bacterium]|nr:PEGA domain-containing protein [Polyangiaceae bacterium]